MGHRSSCDFLIIGGGIIGLTLALEVKRRHPDAKILLIEKEDRCGLHASGRNSGVLHAGFYYTADSLKARFTVEGNRQLTEYCLERGLRINRCGKLVVARNESELGGLDELARRGETNGVELRSVTAEEALELEPNARTHERALFSPSTSSIDPTEVVESLLEDAESAGVRIETGLAYRGRAGGDVLTARGRVSAGYVVNAAGLYADRVARDYGFSADYRILPFKGLYLYWLDESSSFRRHIYPVPELRYPFLGVHVTLTVDGRPKIGPTAIPAFWREHYKGLGNFRLGELLEIGRLETELLVRNSFDFRRLARREIAKYSKKHLVRLASRLVRIPLTQGRWRWGRAGIRAQLLDTRRGMLEMDFRFEGDQRSFHVLNAVSPAFTCAMPFARHLTDEIERLTA